jgi:hypothetical protein
VYAHGLKGPTFKARLACLAAALLIPLAVLGCGSGESASTAAGSDGPSDTKAVLHPLGDSKASGVAVIHTRPEGGSALESKDKTLAIAVKGAEPTGGLEEYQYAVWLTGPNKAILIGTYRVGADEKLEIEPTPLVPFMGVSVADGSTPHLLITKEVPPKFRAAMAEIATFETPPYMGERTLIGTFEGPAAGG